MVITHKDAHIFLVLRINSTHNAKCFFVTFCFFVFCVVCLCVAIVEMSTAKEKERIRLLMLAKKKVEHKLAHYVDNVLHCRVCKRPVVDEPWDAHLKGAEHAAAVTALKEKPKLRQLEQEKAREEEERAAAEQQREKRELEQQMVLVEQTALPDVDAAKEAERFAKRFKEALRKEDDEEEEEGNKKDNGDGQGERKQTSNGEDMDVEEDEEEANLIDGENVADVVRRKFAQQKKEREGDDDEDEELDEDIDIFKL